MSRAWRLPLAALVLGHLLLAVAYGVAVPVLEGPDEPQHLFFAQYVAEEHALPVQSLDEADRGPWEQEGSQPPLYYALLAPLVRLSRSDLTADGLWYNHQNTMGSPALLGNENRFVHPSDREGWPWHGYALAVHLGRLIGAILGAATVVTVWLVTRQVLPPGQRPWLAWSAAAVVAFDPQFLAVSATFSNDVLVVFLSTAALALLLRVVDGHRGLPTVGALCAVSALAPLAKVSGLAVPVFALTTLGAVSWRRRDTGLLRQVVLPLALATLAVAGWWYARNLALYGDPTGLSHMLPATLRRDFHADRWLRGLPAEAIGLWYSTWGIFGWFTVMMSPWAYRAVTAAAGAALVGLAIAARRSEPWDRGRLAWLGAWAAVVVAGLLRWSVIAKGSHGRLLFPAIAVLAAALVAGWRAVLPRAVPDRVLAALVGLAMASLAVYALFGAIRPAYQPAPVVAMDSVPTSARLADVVFDGRLRLVAAEVPPRVIEGHAFPLVLYWQADHAVTRDGYVAVRLDLPVRPQSSTQSDYGWEMLAGTPQLAYLAAGNTPPALLAPGPLYLDRRLVMAPRLGSALDPAASPGSRPAQAILARLSVHLYQPDTAQSWPVTAGSPSGAGDWATDIVVDPAGRPGPAGQSLAPFDSLDSLDSSDSSDSSDSFDSFDSLDLGSAEAVARFGQCVRLFSPAVVPGRISASASLDVVWTASCHVADDLTAFVHLVGPGGADLGVFDRPPATEARYPTSAWRPGEAVRASFPMDLPSGSLPDGARLEVGLYRADGSRLAAYRADGTRWEEDAAVVWQPGP